MTRPAGTSVRIRTMTPPGHIRTPYYLRGKSGTIERALGDFESPEQRAYMLPAPKHQLYRVRFTMDEIWGNEAETPDDTIDAEIFDHWIEDAS